MFSTPSRQWIDRGIFGIFPQPDGTGRRTISCLRVLSLAEDANGHMELLNLLNMSQGLIYDPLNKRA
jgi:hypothetical protein